MFVEKMKEISKKRVQTTPSEDNKENEEESIDTLKAKLAALKSEYDEKKRAIERMSAELGEFSALFPERSVDSIPDSVWKDVKDGIPLAAAYALYEKKTALRAEAARNANSKNGELSTGSIGRESTESFYTPDEVRAMSRTEVRKNYSKIIESMKKWN